MSVEWLPLPHTKAGRHSGIQCEMDLRKMSLTAQMPAWRERRYSPKGLDPEFCIHTAAVDIDGKKFCRLHAGKILLYRAAGPEPRPSVEFDV